MRNLCKFGIILGGLSKRGGTRRKNGCSASALRIRMPKKALIDAVVSKMLHKKQGTKEDSS